MNKILNLGGYHDLRLNYIICSMLLHSEYMIIAKNSNQNSIFLQTYVLLAVTKPGNFLTGGTIP